MLEGATHTYNTISITCVVFILIGCDASLPRSGGRGGLAVRFGEGRNVENWGKLVVNYDHKHQQDHYNYPGPCKYNNMSCHVMLYHVNICYIMSWCHRVRYFHRWVMGYDWRFVADNEVSELGYSEILRQISIHKDKTLYINLRGGKILKTGKLFSPAS